MVLNALTLIEPVRFERDRWQIFALRQSAHTGSSARGVSAITRSYAHLYSTAIVYIRPVCLHASTGRLIELVRGVSTCLGSVHAESFASDPLTSSLRRRPTDGTDRPTECVWWSTEPIDLNGLTDGRSGPTLRGLVIPGDPPVPCVGYLPTWIPPQ